MSTIGPTNPHHVARAYALRPPVSLAPQRPAADVARTATPSSFPVQTRYNASMAGLIGAQVPGGIDFSGDTPRPGAHTLPLYRHPADRNAAATGVHAGRMLDVEG